MSYLGNFFIAIDQLGNVMAGGNPDNTISSRVGYYNSHNYFKNNTPWQWRLFEQIIDASFYPVDGPSHCHEAYYNDAGEVFDPGTNDFLIFLAGCIIIPSCILIALLLYTLFVFGLVSPRKINRNSKVKSRLKTAKAKLNGTLHELKEHPVKIDLEILEKALATQIISDLLVARIKGMLGLKD
ncbi:MAG: hypothetical protein COB98_05545 [Flavobacteriaceae bacterium]|nr:MAG: hypothetical protein COB98_05545 [Flavobacteriaceae bacterium]